MGMHTDYEQMSETYRRIKRKRARERRKRARRNRNLRILLIVLLVVLILAGIGLMIFGKNGKKQNPSLEETISEEYVESGLVESGVILSAMSEQMEPVTQEMVTESATIEYPKLDVDYISISDGDIESPYIAVYDVNSNRILAGKQASSRMYPASMTKVMTLIVAVEHLTDMDATFEMTSEIIDPLVLEGASRVGFLPGEQVCVEDLLYGLILPSGADAAAAIAIMVAGSEEEFARLMNEKCEELGLKNTHFTNPSGLHDPKQYSTPLEIAMILSYAMENEVCAKILSTVEYVLVPNEVRTEQFLLTSTMFSRMYGDEAKDTLILAGKTGYTTEAGNCLVSYGIKNEKPYVVTVAGENGKWPPIFDTFKIYERYAN